MSRHPFEWPSDLYLEFRYMGQAVFLAQVFDSVCQQARQEELEGLAVDPATGQLCMRQITAEQALRIVTENHDILTLPSFDRVQNQLQALVAVAPGAKSLVAWDDQDFKRGLTYVIAKDDNDKRITLVFLNNAASATELQYQPEAISAPQTTITLPNTSKDTTKDSTKADDDEERLRMHAGFYRYLMETTTTPTSDSASNDTDTGDSKYSRIYNELKALTKVYPKYKIYVTGQACPVATGLAQAMAFWLASDSEMPKPVSCLLMGSTPRVGNLAFLKAVQALEQERQMRICRLILRHDHPNVGPFLPDYQHIGFQIKMIPKPPPPERPNHTATGEETPLVSSSLKKNTHDQLSLHVATGEETSSSPKKNTHDQLSLHVTYPKLVDTCWNRFERAWDNRWKLLVPSSSLLDEDYLDSLDRGQHELQKLDLNELYAEEELYTGYMIAPLPVEK